MDDAQLHAKIKRQKKALHEMNRAVLFYSTQYEIYLRANLKLQEACTFLQMAQFPPCQCWWCRLKRRFR